MRNLQAAWVGLFFIGIILISADVVLSRLINIKGVPVVSVIGGALMLLVFTSILNWIFKVAWAERSNSDPPQK